MRILVQRAKNARVIVNNEVISSIDHGYMILVGIKKNDTKKNADKLIKKVINLRIFEDECGKMNLNIQDVCGKILAISQFTLYADTKKGNRPSFIEAENKEKADELYMYVVEQLNKVVETKKGVFGAHMEIDFINDGPVTIMLEDEENND